MELPKVYTILHTEQNAKVSIEIFLKSPTFPTQYQLNNPTIANDHNQNPARGETHLSHLAPTRYKKGNPAVKNEDQIQEVLDAAVDAGTRGRSELSVFRPPSL